MKTRNNDSTRNQAGTRGFITGLLAATVVVWTAMGVPVKAAAPITPTGDPTTDWQNIQEALDGGGEVVLQNGPNGEAFDLTGVQDSLKITRDVTVKGRDDAAGNQAKIIANNFRTSVAGILGEVATAIEVDNPGGTVAFVNLDIESDVRTILSVGDEVVETASDACKDLTVKDCKIVGTHELASCIATAGDLMGTVTLAGNYIAGHWCAGDYAFLHGLTSSAKWEIHSNTFVASGECVDITTSRGLRMENNRCEGPAILLCGSTRGEIVIRNNTMLQSGHFEWAGSNTACGMLVSHENGFGGGLICGNTIEMSPSEDVPLAGAVAMYFAGFAPFHSGGAQGLLVQDNTITGKADWAIFLDLGASGNVIRRNNLEGLTATPYGLFGAGQIGITSACENNVFRDNVLGPLGPGVGVGIYCAGDNNDFIRNDYTKTGIPGLTAGIPCVLLANTLDPATGDLVAEPENNLVFEPTGFPTGTTAADQVLDQPQALNGVTTNTVVGH